MAKGTITFRPTIEDRQRIHHLGSRLGRRFRGPFPTTTEVLRAALTAASELAATDQLLVVLDEGDARRRELSRSHG
jgi:hypothetical protein